MNLGWRNSSPDAGSKLERIKNPLKGALRFLLFCIFLFLMVGIFPAKAFTDELALIGGVAVPLSAAVTHGFRLIFAGLALFVVGALVSVFRFRRARKRKQAKLEEAPDTDKEHPSLPLHSDQRGDLQ
ncbi:MAG: hypothetical protein FWE65_02770 [Eggerthellaceae bacterium]|nr:hypothetical protein [Eggerthellaceae bacterium]